MSGINSELLKSAIYGLAIGDSLGVPYEFRERGSFTCKDMVGHGTHNQVAGTWSDDTSMILATCSSLKANNGKINLEDMSERFKDWVFNGEYTPFGKVFDVGGTTKRALKKGCGEHDIYSNGNGSLMRILPLAFTDANFDDIDNVSSITHAHAISKEGCRIYVTIARKLLEKQDLKSILEDLTVSDDYQRIKNLDKIKEDRIQSSGYVVHTLEASLWCLLNTDSYRDAVIKAVNLGDDTDTTGAVTGGLAGIIYGFDAIPKEWIEILQNKELIDSCIF